MNLLAEFFLRKFSGELRKAFTSIHDDVRATFRSYAWPGNVRELRNLIERIVLIEDDEVLLPRHLPREMFPPGAGSNPAVVRLVTAGDEALVLRPLRDVEEEHIQRVLGHCAGNKSRAARILGLSRQGLIDRLKKVRQASAAL